MPTVIVYRSTDASAPVLTGSVGTLLTVLDACLVNGYSGKAAAGWTKPYANSGNIGCYRNSAVDGTGLCLNVNDAGPGAGGAREARMTGFETMSALSTGTGQFPTSGQLAIGIGAVVLRKSTTADTTARTWTLVADDTVFYFFAETGDVTNPITTPYPFMFGDFFSYKTSDAYRCAIIGRNVENTAGYSNDGFSALSNASGAPMLTYTMIGHYMPRSWTGTGTSIMFGKHVDYSKMGTGVQYNSYSGVSAIINNPSGMGFDFNLIGVGYPHQPDGGLWVSPIWVHHNSAVRGYLKGLWSPSADRPLLHNDTYSGTGNMSSKTFLVQNIPVYYLSGTLYAGQIHIETSSTWS